MLKQCHVRFKVIYSELTEAIEVGSMRVGLVVMKEVAYDIERDATYLHF